MQVQLRTRFNEAYHATTYYVDGPTVRIALRIGCANTDIDKLAAAHQVNTWTYITAYNPGSVAASSEGNEKRQRELIQAVAESGYPFYTGEGKGDSGEWPAEPSLLVLGVGEAEAAAMARCFGQAAVLFGERDRPVRLLWTDGDSATSSQET